MHNNTVTTRRLERLAHIQTLKLLAAAQKEIKSLTAALAALLAESTPAAAHDRDLSKAWRNGVKAYRRALSQIDN